MTRILTKKIALAGMFLAFGLLLPFLTGQIPEIGNMLLPMHLPVMLAGFLLGPAYGGILGFITPLFRSLIFSRPVLFPTAVSMACELCAYGLVAGLCYTLTVPRVEASKHKTVCHGLIIYISLLASMIGGRLVYAIVQTVIMGLGEDGFTLGYFLTEAVLNAIPGIIIQLMLIPILLLSLERAGITKNGALK